MLPHRLNDDDEMKGMTCVKTLAPPTMSRHCQKT